MENENKQIGRLRREYAPRGQKSQKMVTFRLDLENEEWLARQPNKGRYINNLIAADRETHWSGIVRSIDNIGGQ